MNKRNTNLDLLRVTAAVAVIWLHVSAEVVGTNPDIHSLKWWTGNVADAFSRWCVPVFVMISGALLFSSSSNYTPIEFYKKRASRLFIPIVFWTLVYIFFRAYTDSTFNITIAIKSIVNGMPYYHLWYVYMVIGLYFAAPFLRPVVTGVDSGSVRLLIIGCFVIAAIEATLGGSASATFLPRFLPYIGYFLAGYHLLNHRSNLTGGLLAFIVFVCGIIVATATGALFTVIGPSSWEIMYTYLNPIVIIMSLSVFLLFTKNTTVNLLPTGITQRIAPITLGVYLIHPLWLWFLAKFGISGFLIHPVIGIPITTCLAFTLSAISAALLASVPVLNWTVR